MNKNNKIGIMASDLRQVYMAEFLMNNGYSVYLISTDNLACDKKYKESIDVLLNTNNSNKLRIICEIEDFIEIPQVFVTPIPFNKVSEFITIPKFINMLSEREDKASIYLYTGYIDDDFKTLIQNNNINYCDNSIDENLTIFNSIATAEGIIAEAIVTKNTNLHGSKVLVLGFGKCGKTLALKLKGLNADVFVCARREEDLSLAKSFGCNAIDLHNLIMTIKEYDFIFNTIPIVILNEDILKHVSLDTLILDIASMPGGVDKNIANKLDISVKHVLGIPGKYSPKSSGVALGKALMKINT